MKEIDLIAKEPRETIGADFAAVMVKNGMHVFIDDTNELLSYNMVFGYSCEAVNYDEHTFTAPKAEAEQERYLESLTDELISFSGSQYFDLEDELILTCNDEDYDGQFKWYTDLPKRKNILNCILSGEFESIRSWIDWLKNDDDDDSDCSAKLLKELDRYEAAYGKKSVTTKIKFRQYNIDADSGEKYSAKQNAKYLHDISKEWSCLKRSTIMHELFGVVNTITYINGIPINRGVFIDNISLKKAQRYFKGKFTRARNAVRSIFTFTPESADEAGLHSLSDWKEWVKHSIDAIASCTGLQVEDIRYIAAVHIDYNEHPHVHIIWWDHNLCSPIVCNKYINDRIRAAVIKSTYQDKPRVR